MIQTAKELAAAALDVATNYKTLYVMGCFGAPMTQSNKKRYCNNHSFNRQEHRTEKIQAASADTFGFDCVCFIKGLLWGWAGDKDHVYGGATYNSGGVPDYSADKLFGQCVDVSDDFSTIQVGEAVWLPGHIGIYIGGGKAVECTDADADGVQIQAVLPMGQIPGMPGTGWVKHGKLPYVSYEAEDEPEAEGLENGVILPMLRNGDKGGCVKALQALLMGYGYSCGRWGADGICGTGTENALMHYQDDHNLEIDGICGPESWRSLLGIN